MIYPVMNAIFDEVFRFVTFPFHSKMIMRAKQVSAASVAEREREREREREKEERKRGDL